MRRIQNRHEAVNEVLKLVHLGKKGPGLFSNRPLDSDLQGCEEETLCLDHEFKCPGTARSILEKNGECEIRVEAFLRQVLNPAKRTWSKAT